jgi:GntR family transcriptional repressor for pyruvate dehydrogenase complex
VSTLSHGVVEQLTAQIVDGVYRPGAKLPAESALEEQFSVSRTVIREALTRLQAVGLVETHRGKGTYVLVRPSEEAFSADPGRIRTAQDMLELLDFRLGCEVEAAGLAALRRTGSQLARIESSLSSFRAARDLPSKAVEADFQFHRNIAVASNNHYYVELLTSLGPTMIAMPQTRLRAHDAAENDLHYDRVILEHETVVAAIARRDVLAACAAMRTHLSASKARLAG